MVKQFEEADLRTYKLCFAIKTRLKTGLFGSVIIRKLNQEIAKPVFEILHTRDFNPNIKEFIIYKTNLQEEHLAGVLIALCNYYYSLKADNELLVNEYTAPELLANNEIYFVCQCKNCLTIYDAFWGDEQQNVAAGTDFNALSVYQCPTCEAPKEEFVRIAKPAAIF